MLFASGVLLALFYVIDRLAWNSRAPEVRARAGCRAKISIEGLHNVLYLMAVAFTVLVSGIWNRDATLPVGLGIELPVNGLIRDAILIAVGLLSWKTTKQSIRVENAFTWAPMQEVAMLFAAIFITMIPMLAMLKAGRRGAFGPLLGLVSAPDGRPVDAAYFWLTGVLSSFLDNAPTYLAFFNLAGGDAQALMGPLASTLLAISAGAVFMGANTYIGNAPNFMVRSICEERGVKMPSFIGYMAWSGAILLPLFAAVTSSGSGERGSLFEPGDDRLERLDGLRLVVLLQVEQELEPVGLLADDGALAGEIVVEAEHLVAADRLGEALHLDRRLLLGGHLVLHQRIGLVTHEDAVDLGIGLQPRGQIHRAADDRIIHAVLAAEIADGDVARVDADAQVKRLLGAELLPFGSQLPQAPQHGDRHAHARAGVLLDAPRFRDRRKTP